LPSIADRRSPAAGRRWTNKIQHQHDGKEGVLIFDKPPGVMKFDQEESTGSCTSSTLFKTVNGQELWHGAKVMAESIARAPFDARSLEIVSARRGAPKPTFTGTELFTEDWGLYKSHKNFTTKALELP
jgi:hypothetical protein